MQAFCKGFQTVEFARAEKPTDVIGAYYAVYDDGRVYATSVTLAQYRTNTFNFKGAQWNKSGLTADDVAAFAEFNGVYPLPV